MTSHPKMKLVLEGVSEPYRRALSGWADEQDLVVVASGDQPAAYGSLQSTSLCVVEGCGNDLLERLPSIRKGTSSGPIVALLTDGDLDAAVQLMRSEVRDVIQIPSPPIDVVSRASASPLEAAGDLERDLLAGRSASMREVRREIAAVAPTRSSVLLTGETGTGKGLAARLIHRWSKRSDRPFVQVDCGALASSVIESELFGHERGSFTSASDRRPGRFETAANGTIFLDEIGELRLDMQAKLLRVLQDRQFERLGGTRTLDMEARVLAATNRDLESEVNAGRFRADLLFRLNVYRVHLPPLRERPEDLPVLVGACLSDLSRRLQMVPPRLPDSTYRRLSEHFWPGNLRELMNALERLMVRHQAGILVESDLAEPDLGVGARSASSARRLAGPLPRIGSDEERELLESELIAAGGNISRVARRLKLARGTLRYRLSRHDLRHLIPQD